MKYEVKTFHLAGGAGYIPRGWTPLGVVGSEEGTDVWVTCTHAYINDLDSLLEKEDE